MRMRNFETFLELEGITGCGWYRPPPSSLHHLQLPAFSFSPLPIRVEARRDFPGTKKK